MLIPLIRLRMDLFQESSLEEDDGVLTYEELDNSHRNKFFLNTWGPEKFHKENHPLAIMVYTIIHWLRFRVCLCPVGGEQALGSTDTSCSGKLITS